MITLKWFSNMIEAYKAVKTSNSVILYDSDNNETFKIINIYGKGWENISLISGTWSDSSEIPTKFDYLQADIDFLQMENDALTMDNEQVHADIDFLQMLNDGLAMENEQLRADVDYCLMLLDEPELEEPEVEESNGSE